MISAEQRARIRRLFFAEHWKMGTIAAELGIHRDTVARAIETERFTNIAFRTAAAATSLDPYKDFVRATLEQHPRLRSTRLLQMIQGRGYAGSVWPLRRFVRETRPTSIHEAFFRLSMLAGEQARWTGAASDRSRSATPADGCRALSWSCRSRALSSLASFSTRRSRVFSGAIMRRSWPSRECRAAFSMTT